MREKIAEKITPLMITKTNIRRYMLDNARDFYDKELKPIIADYIKQGELLVVEDYETSISSI